MLSRSERIGRCASPGRFAGIAFCPPVEQADYPAALDATIEHRRLAVAVDGAIAQLRTLVASNECSQAAAMLEFQIEMLMDPELTVGTRRLIDSGAGAAMAFATAMNDYIAGFQGSQSDHVQARAIDLVDIRTRVLAALTGTPLTDFPAGCIFVGRDMEPRVFLMHDWSAGGAIILFAGSTASHVALLARARQVPMIVATGHIDIATGTHLLIDAEAGQVIEQDGRPHDQTAIMPVSTRTPAEGGMAGIVVSVNINHLDETCRLDPASIAGIGLVRSEFLLCDSEFFSEESHFARYCAVLKWAGSKSVTIRLLDLGDDKPAIGWGQGHLNPASSGLRGVRLLLANTELLRLQVRALLRAGMQGDIRVLVPMVTVASELNICRQIFSEEAELLGKRGFQAKMPAIGIMVEVPAAALMLETFASADFFSVGTNDLTHFLAATTRDMEHLSSLVSTTQPALLRLIKIAVETAGAMGRPISVCGDMAGDPAVLSDLLACGVRFLSVAPTSIGVISSSIATNENFAGAKRGA